MPKRLTLAQWQQLAKQAGFNLARLAHMPEIALSVRTIERIFTHNFRAPPSHYLQHWWVEAARDYIRMTGASNKEAADKFGFWDEAHLCHVFKHVFSRSPQSFAPPRRSGGPPTSAMTRKYNKLSGLYKGADLDEKVKWVKMLESPNQLSFELDED
jgi:AraC family transcriptional regulator